MADSPTVSEPRTEAGKAHRRYLHAIVHGVGECDGTDECADDILAIEAEAAQPIDVEQVAEVLRILREDYDLPDSSAPDSFVAVKFIEVMARIATQGGPSDD